MGDNSNNRVMVPINQRWISRRIYRGGIHYIDFGDSRADIFEWILTNSTLKRIKIKNVRRIQYESWGKDCYVKTNGYKFNITDLPYVYKVSFRKAEDFVAFKLTWL